MRVNDSDNQEERCQSKREIFDAMAGVTNPYGQKVIAPMISPASWAKQAYSLPLITTQAQWENMQKSLAATQLTVKMAPTAAMVDIKTPSQPSMSTEDVDVLMGTTSPLEERWWKLFRVIEAAELKDRFTTAWYTKEKVDKYRWGHQTYLRDVYYKLASPLVKTMEAMSLNERKAAFTALVNCIPPIANQYLSKTPWSKSVEAEYSKDYSYYPYNSDANNLMTYLVHQSQGKWRTYSSSDVKYDRELSSWPNYGDSWFEEILLFYWYISKFIPNDTAQKRFARQVEDCFIRNYLLTKTPETFLKSLEDKFTPIIITPPTTTPMSKSGGLYWRYVPKRHYSPRVAGKFIPFRRYFRPHHFWIPNVRGVFS